MRVPPDAEEFEYLFATLWVVGEEAPRTIRRVGVATGADVGGGEGDEVLFRPLQHRISEAIFFIASASL